MKPTLSERPIVARFPEERYWDRPVQNFQSCTLVWGDSNPLIRDGGLATLNRHRKTKRSKWVVEMMIYGHLPRATPADVLLYVTALTNAAAAVEWPTDEIVP